jgi:hypothetical protein
MEYTNGNKIQNRGKVKTRRNWWNADVGIKKEIYENVRMIIMSLSFHTVFDVQKNHSTAK